MADRKQTPDILGEILGGQASPPPPASEPAPKPAQKKTSKPATPRKTTQRQSTPRASSQPQTWEYMEVVFRDYGGYRPRFVNGRELSNWKKAPLIYKYLNQLGEQGWELAAVGTRVGMEMPAYFKRPKGV